MTAKSTDIPRFDDTEEPDTTEWTNLTEADAHRLLELQDRYGYGELIRTLGIWLKKDED